MKRSLVPLCLLVLAACEPPKIPTVSLPSLSPASGAETIPVSGAAPAGGDGSEICRTRAESRLGMFDKPDTYPISADERQNAYFALFNQCMREFQSAPGVGKQRDIAVEGGNTMAAAPLPPVTRGSATQATPLAGLSPAAGGSATYAAQPHGTVSAVASYPAGTVVINTNDLAAMSPAAGGARNYYNPGTPYGNHPSVVVVQAPPAAAAVSYSPPPPPRPAAIPVAPLEDAPAAAAAPAPAKAAAPAKPQPLPAQAEERSAPEPVPSANSEKTQDPKTRPVATTDTSKQSRFQRNAQPVVLPNSAPPAPPAATAATPAAATSPTSRPANATAELDRMLNAR